MESETLIEKVKKYLSEENYVAAGMLLRNTSADDELRYEAIGLMVADLTSKISEEKRPERLNILRSMLIWVFKEAPELANIYREQLRMARGGPLGLQDISRFLGLLGNFQTPRWGSGEGSETGTGNSGEFGEQIKDFFEQSGMDVDEGIKRANEFFDSLSGRRKEGFGREDFRKERDASDQDREQ